MTQDGRKYTIAFCLALATETAIAIAYIALSAIDAFSEYQETIFVTARTLHSPGAYLLRIIGGETWQGFTVIPILLLTGVIQYFIIAMAVIRLRDLWTLRLKPDDSNRFLRAMCYSLWTITSMVIIAVGASTEQTYRLQSRAIHLGSQGMHIHRHIGNTLFDRTPIPMESPWPTDRFSTSTSYFLHLIESKRFDIDDYNIFFVPSAHSKGAEGDTPELNSLNNAWAVTILSSPNRRPDNAPFLISRNIGFGDPPGPYQEGMTTADMSGLIADDPLLKGKYGVVFTYGGSLRIISRSEARQETLNPSGHALQVLPP